ncbi:helix-turn-helix transcriptional regulator [Aeromicrobium sp. UC242_57]|uniref:helix-turn-helix transcriptional regulator n=1 Tax=Aeromicrobium sp. UC242_57 TaxID=3374624 RepID=UPI0037ACC422
MVVDPLSPRERLAAELAAGGASNADIAAELGLSVRTVENHLARAYVKLGITSRAELRAALRPVPAGRYPQRDTGHRVSG